MQVRYFWHHWMILCFRGGEAVVSHVVQPCDPCYYHLFEYWGFVFFLRSLIHKHSGPKESQYFPSSVFSLCSCASRSLAVLSRPLFKQDWMETLMSVVSLVGLRLVTHQLFVCQNRAGYRRRAAFFPCVFFFFPFSLAKRPQVTQVAMILLNPTCWYVNHHPQSTF